MNWIKKILGIKPKQQCAISDVVYSAVYVTLGWDGHPTTTKDCKHILPRTAEMIINDKYYPTNTIGEWPCDPETGERLPIEPH